MSNPDTFRRLQPRYTEAELDRIAIAGSPVRCTCGRIYDLQAVTVTGRYADCTAFTTPCCQRTADDRTWKGMPDFVRIDKREALGR